MSDARPPVQWRRWQAGDGPPRLRVLCFPYAGGSGAVFRAWSRALADVEICAPELPGRGRLRDVAPLTDMDALLDALVQSAPLDLPYVVFGHSMGAAVGHAFVARLSERGARPPLRFFASACRPPHLPRRGTPLHQRSDAALLEAVDDARATAMLDQPVVRQRLAMLRADLTLYENYKPARAVQLQCPVTAFGGVDDPMISRDELTRWRDLTTASFVRRMMPGDHFFIIKQSPPLLRALGRELDSIVSC